MSSKLDLAAGARPGLLAELAPAQPGALLFRPRASWDRAASQQDVQHHHGAARRQVELYSVPGWPPPTEQKDFGTSMPQDRILLHAGSDFNVEDVLSHPAPAEWSPLYTVASQRFVFPLGNTAMELRCHDETWLIDDLTAMDLASATDYRLRPCVRGARRSLVVSTQAPSRDVPQPTCWLLHPRALYRLHGASRHLQAGRVGAVATAALMAEVSRGQVQIRPQGAVARARRLLTTDPHGCLGASLLDIADAVSSSPFHLARSFRRQTGLSLHQYRQYLRLAAALGRLADGDQDLAGLAHDLGFCSQSHLGAVFRREAGVTLGQARQVLAP